MNQLAKDLRDEAEVMRNEGDLSTASLLEQAADEIDGLESRLAAATAGGGRA